MNKSSTAARAVGVRWDLTDLYGGPDDPRLKSDMASIWARAEAFERRYRGAINVSDLSVETLHEALREYESILQAEGKLYSFASLAFAADTSDAKLGALLQSVTEWASQVSIRLLPFSLELAQADESVVNRVLADERLSNYRHFVKQHRSFRPHRLTEAEERVMEELATTGRRAFERLFEETVAAMRFDLEENGKVQHLTEAEVLALMRSPDRETRRRAAEALTRGLREHSRILTFIFNTLVLDKAIEDRLRRYDRPESARHLSNELSHETVETVIGVCEEYYPLVSRYYTLKREILGYDELTHYDRYAPLFETKREVPFDEAKTLILSAFERFSPAILAEAEPFFANGWIDAEVRPGKRGGAFCDGVAPDLHPYILVNYLGRVDDVMTLAHELGHGVHDMAARRQTYLSYHCALPVAELASTFAEMLVFESLREVGSLEDRLALYAERIEGGFATIFRQAAMYRFEQDLHRARREKGELTSDEIGELWQKRIQQMFGDSLKLGDDHRLWWMYVSHFTEMPFYVYAYSFGELLVMSLYRRWKEEGPGFADKYLSLLAAGGSMGPKELLAQIGIDIDDPAFWRGGMSVLEGTLSEFAELYREWREGRR
ncbi:MAG: M3 family oligoendopeptidase [Armatimonadota bacterium]